MKNLKKFSMKQDFGKINIFADSYQIPENSYENGMFQSPIWNPEVRNQVSMTKLTTQEINNYRSKKIVPGFDVDDIIPDEIQSRIPILLVQRAGVIDCQSGRMGKKRKEKIINYNFRLNYFIVIKFSGLGSGWDIISPAGYGMPIWQSLIFRGARSGGLRETELLQLECNKLNNYLQPDSAAGTADSEYKFRELRNRYFRLPPNKRPNYIKLGVPSPFHCPWNLLVREWIQSTYSDESKKSQNQEFRVLRSRLLLEELNQIIKKFPSRKFVCFDDLIKNIGKNCLIPVIIKCTNKGKPKDLALICLPEVQDLSSNIGPLEISHADENKDFRKILRSEHTKLLKSLRRKRRKDRSKLKENFANDLPVKMSWRDILKSNSAPSEEHTKEYKAKMESLWVPEEEKVKSIINYSSRKIIGFVVKGDFCFSKAISTAVGYVTIVGLIELLKIFKENKTKLKVLIRNNNQFQYRFGNLEILNE